VLHQNSFHRTAFARRRRACLRRNFVLWGVKIRCAFPKNADLQVGPAFWHPARWSVTKENAARNGMPFLSRRETTAPEAAACSIEAARNGEQCEACQ